MNQTKIQNNHKREIDMLELNFDEALAVLIDADDPTERSLLGARLRVGVRELFRSIKTLKLHELQMSQANDKLRQTIKTNEFNAKLASITC